mmetsp:Transcript_76332/g.184697  ORF Transcript_76332/g.184697 Transcript_76332/m.184697 type:complete len:957 (-) Transcript_76332:109-2979(-)
MAFLEPYDPVVNGLHPGTLVEIVDLPEPGQKGCPPGISRDLNGSFGQLLHYSAEDAKFAVQMLEEGEYLDLPPANVRAAPEDKIQKPGLGGGESSFDIVLGPRTQKQSIGEEVANCLSEKGFCLMKIIQSGEHDKDTVAFLHSLEEEGKFGRLPQEIEEGHLGKNGKAKAMWVNPDEMGGTYLETTDNKMTGIAQIVMPFTEDVLGCPLLDRTPGLCCLSMNDADEAEYDVPSATDEELTEYYETWYRSQLRLVQFFGPAKGSVTLTAKETSPFEGPQSEYRLAVGSNTLLLVREDALQYSFEEPEQGEVAWLQCFLMTPGPGLNFDGEITGDFSVLEEKGYGPPGPVQDTVAVVSIAIQCAANMYDHHKEWASYMGGTDGQLEIPFLRFDYRPYYSDEVDMPINTTFVKHCAVQEGIDMFDNRIFEISNMDAEAMCPQCRQVLEVGCLILHQRGITKKMCNTHPIHASVSVGCDKEEWLNMPGVPRSVATNNQLAITANRFNYIFNLKGGSYVCDTACSSSLVATHLGKVNLLERRWDPLEWHMAQGTNLSLTVGLVIGGSASHMLSPGGRCFTFNATANGYNRGDGTACMLLKAGHCEDQRMCFFRGSQMGQDGRSASMSAPNGPAQEKCVWGAIREARMQPPESTTWECHGTGTSLGDPIEVGAIKKIMLKTERTDALLMGTSKSNIGHLEGGAGMASMVKCVVQVLRCECQPTLHLGQLNPHLEHAVFEGIFDTEATQFRHSEGNSHVSSFGFGGSNGHVIFYGKGMQDIGSVKEQILRRLKSMSPPEVRPVGESPEEWESDLPGADVRPGDVYKIFISSEDPPDAPLRWVRESRAEEDSALADTFYSITGNFNDWQDDRMEAGEVPGHHAVEVEVPESGLLEFRFLKDGDPNQALGPEVANCSQKLVPIIGPKDGFTHSWSLRADPGTEFRIELCDVRGSMGVLWFQKRAT